MIDKDLLKLLGNNKKYIPQTVLLMIVGLLLNLSVTVCICYAIYQVTVGDFNHLYIPFGLMMVMMICRYFVTRKVGNLKDVIGRSVKKELREKVYDKLIQLGVRSTDEMSMAGLTQVAMEGIEQLDLYYSTYIPQFFFAMIAPIILFMICVNIDWKVATVLLVCVPLIPMSIIAVSKYAKKIFAKYWGKYTSMGDSFLDSVQGLKELKIFQADKRYHQKMNEHAEEFRIITMKVLVMQLASTTIMDLVAYGGAGLGIAFALMGVINQGLHPIAGLFLILVAVDFFLPLRAFGSAFHIAMNGVSAGHKILDLISFEVPIWGNENIQDYSIQLDHVNFSYDDSKTILKNINLDLPTKGMVSIVGHSGCGKSTLVNLLYGVIRPTSGHVYFGNQTMTSFNRENFYQHIGVVSYNTYIFNESVRNNFKLANPNITDKEIYAALRKTNLYDFIKENGDLDKVIMEDANNISGGQKQRLALAIQLVTNKEIYIFDEATSNIDIESEKIIMDNIQTLAKEHLVIVISHRLANVVSSNQIYYMDAGEIIEQGHHQDLLKKNGAYATLYTQQKQLEEGYREGCLDA